MPVTVVSRMTRAAAFQRIERRRPTVLAADERAEEARCARDDVTARSRSGRQAATPNKNSTHRNPTRSERQPDVQAIIVINRRRFLQDGQVATAGLPLLPAAVAAGEALRQAAPVSFDLHAHPGAFFNKGRPEYAGDAAIVKTVAGMRDAKLTGGFFSLVADAPLLERTPTGIVPHGAYAAGDGAREYHRQLGILRELLTTTPAFLATRSSDLLARIP